MRVTRTLSLSFLATSLVLTGAAFAVAQSEPGQTSTSDQTTAASTVLSPTPTDTESPLVRAAREARARRKVEKKIITNSDVKKSKGRLTINTPPPLPEGTTSRSETTDTRAPLEKQDAQYRARKVAEARIAKDEKIVDQLERDLASIEQSYYEEKDPDLRDTVIQKRFAQSKRQLEDARKELADARDALAAATPTP